MRPGQSPAHQARRGVPEETHRVEVLAGAGTAQDADGEPGGRSTGHVEVVGVVSDHHDLVLAITSHLPHLLSFALVHDLPEADTGDMPTLVPLTDEQRKEKAEKEAVAIERFRRETFPWLARWIDLYELRECAESRFVSACDKMIPMLTHERNGCAVAKRFYDYPAFEETMWKRQELAELLYPEFPALMATRRALTQRALDAWNRSDDKEHSAESLSWVSTQQASP